MHTPLDDPPEVLAHQAREMASSFGYPKRPADSRCRSPPATARSLKQLPQPHQWDDWLARRRPSLPTIARASRRWSRSLRRSDARQSAAHRAGNGACCWMAPGGCAIFRPTRTRMRKPSRHPSRPKPFSTPPASTWRVSPRRPRRSCRPALRAAAFLERAASRIPGLNLTVDLASWKGRITEAPSVSTGPRRPLATRRQAP
jgi:hypothetical protein